MTLACGPSLCPSPLVEGARRQNGLELVEISRLRRDLSPLDDARALVSLVHLFRSRRFDVVHTHTSKAGALGGIAAAIASRAPVVHQPHGHLFYGYRGCIGTWLLILTERLLAPLARRQIVLSWRGAEEHLARNVGRPGQFTIVRSGIDLRPFRRERQRRDACRRRLGLRPGLRLFLGGDGPLGERLLAAARRAGVPDRVTVASSWVAAPDFLPALDLFALVSRNERMGRALVEAMATGLPILATNVGGMPEVLEEGQAGLLVPPLDREAIGEAILRLMDDPRLARDLARRARARSVAFGAGRMGRALLRVYREVLR